MLSVYAHMGQFCPSFDNIGVLPRPRLHKDADHKVLRRPAALQDFVTGWKQM